MGIVAMVNILGRGLSRSTEHVLLILGTWHWLLGGLICWGLEGVQINMLKRTPERPARMQSSLRVPSGLDTGPHHISEFVLPGGGKIWLARKF